VTGVISYKNVYPILLFGVGITTRTSPPLIPNVSRWNIKSLFTHLLKSHKHSLYRPIHIALHEANLNKKRS